jgi:hypothetical protein
MMYQCRCDAVYPVEGGGVCPHCGVDNSNESGFNYKDKVYEMYSVVQDILYDAERGKITFKEAYEQLCAECGGNLCTEGGEDL